MKDRMHLSVRFDNDVHDKIQYIAKYEGRSMSGQILHLIQTCIREFETKHGPITQEDLSE